MRFRREVYDSINRRTTIRTQITAQQLRNDVFIADIRPHEMVPEIAPATTGQVLQIFGISTVCEQIQVRYVQRRFPPKSMAYEVRADETASAGNQYMFERH
jgi:hypothetical protein